MKKVFLLFAILITLSTASAQPQIIAHRGYWDCDVSAQNSLSSFRNAQKLRLFGSECDVSITSDGVVIMNHDNDINGIEIVKTAYSDLKEIKLSNGETVPTLDACLALLKSNPATKLIIELKPKNEQADEDRAIAAVKESVDRFDVAPNVEYISFSLHACRELRRLIPDAKVYYLASSTAKALTPAQAKAENFTGIDYHTKLFVANPQWVAECRELGLKTNVWTVNTEEMMREMIKLNVDYITTDKPIELISILNENQKIR